MRDFRVQEMLNIWRVFSKKDISRVELIKYLFCWINFGIKRPKANKLFDRKDFGYLRKIIFKLGSQDPVWFPRLVEPSTFGLRGWEYGLLFDKIRFKNKKILDIGSGNSRLPAYLAHKGAEVTMLDMESPLEETVNRRAKNLKFVLGDMTHLKFKKNSFDIVLCISALEHVDMKTKGFYGEKQYFDRAIEAIRGMIKVLKPGGDFYLTTEFYLPQQTSDRWVYSRDQIRGSFKFAYLPQMIKVLQDEGIKFDSTPEIDPKILELDPNRANFRGRYMSTFAFRGKKI